MTLRNPWMLLLLLLIPLLLYLRYGRPRRRLTIPFSHLDTLLALPRAWTVTASRLLSVLYTFGLITLIIALSRPARGLQESRVETEAVDIVLLIDLSTSMRAEDLSTPSERLDRLEASKKVIREFIDNRPNDRIGAVAFAALPYTVSPLTMDRPWLTQRIEDLQTGSLEDGTAIGSGLASAINRLRESKAKSKVIILLTDGVNNAGSLSPENAAQTAKALGIKVYTVGAGTTGIVRMPVTDVLGNTVYGQQFSQIDETSLQRIAHITDALYFRARDFQTLREVYGQIDQLEKTKIEIEEYTRYEEKFLPWAVAAALLLLSEKILSLTRLGRLTA